MSSTSETFFTAVGCMDGRVQEAVAKFGRERFGSMYPDTITEAGLVGLLAKDAVNPVLSESLKFKIVAVSLGKHKANGIVVHGHAECAGNPIDDAQHKDDIRRSVTFITKLIGTSTPVVGVFVHRSNQDPKTWVAEEVPQTAIA